MLSTIGIAGFELEPLGSPDFNRFKKKSKSFGEEKKPENDEKVKVHIEHAKKKTKGGKKRSWKNAQLADFRKKKSQT